MGDRRAGAVGLAPGRLTAPYVVLGRRRSSTYNLRTPPAGASLGPRLACHSTRRQRGPRRLGGAREIAARGRSD